MQPANSIPIPIPISISATRETAQVAQSHLRTNGVVVTGSS